MSDFEHIEEPMEDFGPSVPNTYYKLDTGEVYDRVTKEFVTTDSNETYAQFVAEGGQPLSIGENGYTLEQLKRGVCDFYGWEKGECLLSVDELRERLMTDLELTAASFEENLNKEMYFTSSLGFRVNGDRRTRSNIEDLIAMLPDDETTVSYRDYDNQNRELTRPQLQVMLRELIQAGLNCYTTKWRLQGELKAAKSKNALKKISLVFEWPDYSKQPLDA